MDNLDQMIHSALSGDIAPEEALIRQTAIKMAAVQRENRLIIDTVFLTNLLGVLAAMLFALGLPVMFQYVTALFILSWLSAIIPLYLVARLVLRNMLSGSAA